MPSTAHSNLLGNLSVQCPILLTQHSTMTAPQFWSRDHECPYLFGPGNNFIDGSIILSFGIISRGRLFEFDFGYRKLILQLKTWQFLQTHSGFLGQNLHGDLAFTSAAWALAYKQMSNHKFLVPSVPRVENGIFLRKDEKKCQELPICSYSACSITPRTEAALSFLEFTNFAMAYRGSEVQLGQSGVCMLCAETLETWLGTEYKAVFTDKWYRSQASLCLCRNCLSGPC